MFKKLLTAVGLRKALPPIPESRVDRCLGDRPAKMVKLQLDKGEWRSVRDAMARTRDHAARSLLLNACVDCVVDKQPKWVDDWTESYPTESLTWTVRGSLSLDAAGKARGSAKAEQTSDEQFGEMEDLMDIAHQQFDRAIELDPSDLLPWARLLWVAIATSAPPEVKQRLYDGARARGETWFGLEKTMLTALTKKWGGSHEQMFSFARKQSASAPVGSAIHGLLVEAHYERMLYAFHWDHTIQEPQDYFKDGGVRKEIVKASQKVQGVTGTDGIAVANLLSFAFWASGDLMNAHLWLQRTNAIQTHPWTPQLRALATKQVNQALS